MVQDNHLRARGNLAEVPWGVPDVKVRPFHRLQLADSHDMLMSFTLAVASTCARVGMIFSHSTNTASGQLHMLVPLQLHVHVHVLGLA